MDNPLQSLVLPRCVRFADVAVEQRSHAFLTTQSCWPLSSIAASDGQYSVYLHIFYSSVCGYAVCPLPPLMSAASASILTSFVSCMHETVVCTHKPRIKAQMEERRSGRYKCAWWS